MGCISAHGSLHNLTGFGANRHNSMHASFLVLTTVLASAARARECALISRSEVPLCQPTNTCACFTWRSSNEATCVRLLRESGSQATARTRWLARSRLCQ